MAPLDVHTCPRCELRFATTAEMQDHLLRDHDVVLQRSAYKNQPVRPDERLEPSVPPPSVRGLIMVPVDPVHGPTGAERVAASLAGQASMAVDLVTVRPAGVSEASAEAYLAKQARDASSAGAPVVSWRVFEQGEPVEGIIAHVTERRPTLLCMGTRARGALGEMLLGSVSEAVVRRSPVPVVLVGPKAQLHAGPCTRLIVAVDGSEASKSSAAVAAVLAGELSVPVVLVEVREVGADPHDVPETAMVHQLASRLSPPADYDVLHGKDPARAIVDLAAREAGALIAVGTHGRTGLRRLTMGSVALDVVRHAPVPVMVVPEAAASGEVNVVEGGERSAR